jgi:glycosyltransferase involved in cell wall biosynthesis
MFLQIENRSPNGLHDRGRKERAGCRASSAPVVLHTRVVTESGGGPDKTILNSPRFLASAGYRALCAYMHPPGDPGFRELQSKADLWQAPLLSVPDRGPWDWRVVTELVQICRRERVRIWHAHDYKSNALGLVAKLFWPMRLVTTVHGWVKETRRTPLYYQIDRLCLPYYERVICVSDDLCAACTRAGVRPERCLLVENAIDTEQYRRSQTTASAKQKIAIDGNRFLIGAVGRLSAEKGFDILIRSAVDQFRAGLNGELVIIGEGADQARLTNLIAELGCAERVRLLGYRADMKQLYEAMDVFALSSLREGLPNVLLEAMALEVPIVATRIAGVPRVIEDEQNGLLAEPGSQDDLTRQVRRLAQDAGLRQRLCQAARHTVETRYSFDARMQKIRAVYDGLLRRQSANDFSVR